MRPARSFVHDGAGETESLASKATPSEDAIG